MTLHIRESGCEKGTFNVFKTAHKAFQPAADIHELPHSNYVFEVENVHGEMDKVEVDISLLNLTDSANGYSPSLKVSACSNVRWASELK
ncbi:hypothetical protein PV11_09120 [Exophiala sideris]|uniref:Uncharacterized protein n=1 Tax=Exophiala sideris TaxID=1016849 RepID=A0A0D1Y922_9EURO|nr:hypothetical protein PV11_09120 [Exophiala sideris]